MSIYRELMGEGMTFFPSFLPFLLPPSVPPFFPSFLHPPIFHPFFCLSYGEDIEDDAHSKMFTTSLDGKELLIKLVTKIGYKIGS